MSRPALVVTCVGCWQNKLMRVIYHAACAVLNRRAAVSISSHLSYHGGLTETEEREGEEMR